MKQTAKNEPRRPNTEPTRGAESDQDESPHERAVMATRQRLMKKAEACGDYRTAASILKDIEAAHERRAQRAAASAAAPRLTLQETLEQICYSYNLDPTLALPQRERLKINAGNVSPDDSPAPDPDP